MTKDLRRKNTKIEVVDEPEIQYAASAKLFEEIQSWLSARGGVDKKSERDSAIYYDTTNFRLLREGIEYRVKEKGSGFRHDMKTPLDTHDRAVVPDANDILWRKEMKFKTSTNKPSLAAFFGQTILEPVRERVIDFFDKRLEPKFRSSFFKHKVDYETGCGASRVEYSFQTGHMETPDGTQKGKLLYILELELRDGDEKGLLDEKRELERVFGPKGLRLLPDRKIMLGFELLVPSMSKEQLRSYEDAKDRNGSLGEAESCILRSKAMASSGLRSTV